MILERQYIPKGAIIMRQGDEGTTAYLIQSGAVSVFTEQSGERVELARLETGQIFGDTALIFDGRRTASVLAVEDCNLIIITRQAFQEKLKKSDPTVRALLTMLSNRMMTNNNTMLQNKSTVDDLSQTAQMIYQNYADSLPADKLEDLQDMVLPALQNFFSALDEFQKKHS